MDIDPLALRRRNLLEAADLPWRMPGGAVVTSGEFTANLDRAVELAGWSEAPARRKAAKG